ncbi:prolipoprotein diacylglyceryl transferase [Terrimonas alba]|uniref:prolipoprotein diacylglyceryl transferase n=1 Tax=Terrimonas alba TaxID=3349636 RepID=UPI0035F2CC9C
MPILFGVKINIHLIFEWLAFFISFRYYVYLRKQNQDHISGRNRLSIILGAIIGAFIGSRLVGFLENPLITFNANNIIQLLNAKSIMGGLFGGLIGVETAKRVINEKHSSGDLFTFPIIIGIIIGRIGCFLSGTNEFTYGSTTNLMTGMDLGDGLLRHPTSLYELIFLLVLFLALKRFKTLPLIESGLLFKSFMISYFGFRFLIEFIKPNVFFVLGMSSIQWLCMICWIYYLNTFKKLVKNAYQKLYLLRLHN